MAKKAGQGAKKDSSANLGFEEKLWAAADKLRGHMDAAEYKHVLLGLVFLKYISDAFQELHDALAADKDSDPEDKEFLSRAYTVLGGAYRAMGGKDQDALISYLTVDLVYNVLPESHAEALFNLGELWERGSNPERSREARQSLKSSYPASQWTAKLGNGKS